MKSIKIALVAFAAVIVAVSAGYIARQNLETRRSAAGGANLSYSPDTEICLGETGVVTVSSRSNQGITGYALKFNLGTDLVEVENVSSSGFQNPQWGIVAGNLNTSAFNLSQSTVNNFQISITLEGIQPGRFDLQLVSGEMAGDTDPVVNVNSSDSITITVVNCGENTPTPTPTDGVGPTSTPPEEAGDVNINFPSRKTICVNESELVTISGIADSNITGFALDLNFNPNVSSISNVSFDDNWSAQGDWGVGNSKLRLSAFSMSQNLPETFRIDVELLGNTPGRFNFSLDQGSGTEVAGTNGQVFNIQVNGSTAILVQDCQEPTNTPGPTDTPRPTSTDTPPEPTETPQPTNTDTPPQPTNTESPSGCKPCPDGGYVGSVADYNCDGTINMEDFAGWYDDYKLNSNYLYGDFNCNGQLDEGDVNQWYAELPKF